MTGTITCSVDTSVFNLMMAALREIVPQDAAELLCDETARLAEECAKQLSLRSVRKKGGLDKDIRSVFAPMPKHLLPEKNRNGKGMTWISAGPESVVGVKPWRFHDTDSAQDMMKLFYKSKGTLPEERKVELGVHGESHLYNYKAKKYFGKQRVYELQRVVVRKSALREFRNNLRARYGRLEASFAKTAKLLRGSTSRLVKAYIAKHLNGEALPNITDLTGLANKISPRMEFGSFAPGVEGFEGEIQDACDVRVEKMEKRGQRILNAYAKQISAGQIPTVFAKQSAED
jgi:hypothetical protein